MFFSANNTARRLALIQMLIAVILANMNPILSKALFFRGWTPLGVYFMTLLIIAMILILHEFMDRSRALRWSMRSRDIYGILITSLTGGVLSPLLFFTGLKQIVASEAVILTSLHPLFVVLFGILILGERFTAKMLFGGALLVAGIIAVLWPDIIEFSFQPGAFLILGSSLCGALTTVLHKKFVTYRHLDSIVLVRTILSIAIVGTLLFLTEPDAVNIFAKHENVWLVLSVPVVAFILPYFLFFSAIGRVQAFDVGVIEAAGRVFAVFAATVLLKEILTVYHLISVFLIIFGVLFINVPLTKWRIVPSRLMEAGPLRK